MGCDLIGQGRAVRCDIARRFDWALRATQEQRTQLLRWSKGDRLCCETIIVLVSTHVAVCVRQKEAQFHIPRYQCDCPLQAAQSLLPAILTAGHASRK